MPMRREKTSLRRVPETRGDGREEHVFFFSAELYENVKIPRYTYINMIIYVYMYICIYVYVFVYTCIHIHKHM